MKFLQTQTQVKNMIFNYYDLCYTVIKKRDDNDIGNNNENDYIKFNDIITPNHYVGIEPQETILRWEGEIEVLDKSFQVILTI